MPVLILAIPGALIIGFTLGLLGSGGSILTVPVLVYMLGQDEKVAIASSLAIVGLISLFGSIPYIKRQVTDWKMVALFGLPGVAGTYVGAWASVLVSGVVQMTVFAGVMMAAAYFMIKPAKEDESSSSSLSVRPLMIVVEGLAVGVLTGFVGVGGGFLIVPALVLLGGISMHRAIATSLVIISMKSMAGFIKYVDVLDGAEIDYTVIGLFSVVGFIGCVMGGYVAPLIPQDKLKKTFGLVLIAMGIFIFYQTIPGLVAA
jgi:uncharacterized membrane protein YfcA